IDPGCDLNPLAGRWVLDGIRRILAREVWAIRIEGVRIAGSLGRARVLPGPPSLRAGTHRTDGSHVDGGEDPQADGQDLRAGCSGVWDNRGSTFHCTEALPRAGQGWGAGRGRSGAASESRNVWSTAWSRGGSWR